MNLQRITIAAVGFTSMGWISAVSAAGGPLGIDSRLNSDNQGIWKRGNQLALQAIRIGGEIAGDLYEGSDTGLGKTFWQSIDRSIITPLALPPL